MVKKEQYGEVLLRLALFVVALVACLVLVPVAVADGGVADSAITVDVTVEDSSWKVNSVSIENLTIPIPESEEILSVGAFTVEDVSEEALNKLARTYMATELVLPEVPSDVITFLEESDIRTLVIRKTEHSDYQEVNVYANDTLLVSTRASDKLLEALSEEMEMDELERMLWDKFFSMRKMTIILRTAEEETTPISVTDEADLLDTAPANYVSVGATVDAHPQETEIVSLAGFTAEELNTVLAEMSASTDEYTPRLPVLDTVVFQQLDIEKMTVKAGRNGLEVSLGERRWAKIFWDTEGREVIYDQLPAVEQLIGQQLPVSAEQLPMLERALRNTELVLQVYVSDSDKPSESLPTVYADGVALEVDETSNLLFGGQPLYNLGIDFEQLEGILPLRTTFDGGDGTLKTAVVGNKPMPVVFFEPGSLPPVLESFVNENMPWEKVEKVLQNVTFSLVLTPEDVLPAGYDTAYPVTRVTALRGLTLNVSADAEGNFALGGTRISSIVESVNPGTKEMVADYVAAWKFEQTELTLGPNAIAINLDGAPPLGVRWDATLRDDVLEYVPLPELPFGLEAIFPAWDRQAVDLLLSRRHELQLQIAEELPESSAEKWLLYLLE